MSTGGITVVFCNACGAHNAPDARFCQSCGQAMAAVAPIPVTASIAAYASHPFGGFWIRFLAWIIDALLVGVVLIPLSAAFGLGLGVAGSVSGMPGEGVTIVRGLMHLGLQVVLGWLYEALLTSSSKQATLGKMALGLRVTDVAGNQISFGRATGRVFAKYLSAMTLLIGYIMIAFTEKKQGLHDLLVGTLVQKTR